MEGEVEENGKMRENIVKDIEVVEVQDGDAMGRKVWIINIRAVTPKRETVNRIGWFCSVTTDPYFFVISQSEGLCHYFAA